MSETGNGSHPVLVYNRIAHNQRKTWMLVAASILALLPFVATLSWLLSIGVVGRVRSESRATRSVIRSDQRLLRRMEANGTRGEYSQWLERDIEDRKAQLAKSEEEDWQLTVKLMPVFAGGLMAAMGILFWGIVSSPTSKLLVQVGAMPATDKEG